MAGNNGKVIGYVRVSTDKQDLNNQKVQLIDFVLKKKMRIDEFVDIEISTRKSQKQRRIGELTDKLKSGDTLIVSELSRLGRSTGEVITLIDKLLVKAVRVIVIKQNLNITAHDMQSKVMVTLFSLFSELERDLISVRTKEALAVRKANGYKLGKPKGTIQKSKFDEHVDRIKELLALGLSVRKIASLLGFSNHIGLNNYIKSRGIKNMIETNTAIMK